MANSKECYMYMEANKRKGSDNGVLENVWNTHDKTEDDEFLNANLDIKQRKYRSRKITIILTRINNIFLIDLCSL